MPYNRDKSFVENLATAVTARMIVDAAIPDAGPFKRAAAVTIVEMTLDGKDRSNHQDSDECDQEE